MPNIDFDYPDDSRVWGPDVSFYQDEDETPRGIDFVKMKEEGADFVIIRAGQNMWVDQDFRVNWAAAGEAGLLRSAYWFLDGRVSANSQALLFRGLLLSDPGELPPVVDYEHDWHETVRDKKGKTKSVEKSLTTQHLYGFLETLDWPVPPIIYTGPHYWLEHGSWDDVWAEHPLWIAHYKTDRPMVPAPWKDWLFWQFTETGPGKVLGAESNAIDLNYFHGTKEQLNKFANRTEVPEGPVQAAEPTIRGKVSVTVTLPQAPDGPIVKILESEF